MQTAITRKVLKNYYKPTIAIGYCNAQTLLRYENPIYYNYGIYGWNWNGYVLENAIICTGYRNLYGINPSHEILRLFENKAKELCKNMWSDDNLERKITALLNGFIKVTLKGVKA